MEKSIEKQQQWLHSGLIWGRKDNSTWWPGMIDLNSSFPLKNLYRVDFFGDLPSYSFLPKDSFMEYKHFQKKQNKGRPSPQLKRAIAQASMLYQAMEDSKCFKDRQDASEKQSVNETNQQMSSVQSLLGLQTNFAMQQNKINKISQSLKTEKQRKKLKEGKKMQNNKKESGEKLFEEKMKKNHIKIEQNRYKRFAKEMERKKNAQNFSTQDKENNEQKLHELLARKLYKVMKIEGKGSLQCAHDLAQRIHNSQQFWEVIEEIKGK